MTQSSSLPPTTIGRTTDNWGEDAFPWGQGLVNGANIHVKAGTYDVYLNNITGDYNFIKK
jgi:hypothetical protein